MDNELSNHHSLKKSQSDIVADTVGRNLHLVNIHATVWKLNPLQSNLQGLLC